MISRQSLACASCGSGAETPVVLYPNEDAKVYVGASFHRLSPSDVGVSRYVSAKQALLIAAAHRLVESNFYLTGSIQYLRQIDQQSSELGWSDPIVGLFWQVLNSDFTQPWLPQILVRYQEKFRTRSGLIDMEEFRPAAQFGNGYRERSIGLDLYSGSTSVQWGLAHATNFAEPRHARGFYYRPSLSHRTTASIGSSFDLLYKLQFLAGLIRKVQGPFTVGDDEIAESAELSHTIFAAVYLAVDPSAEFRLIYSNQGHLGSNHNTTKAQTLTASVTIPL